MKHPSTFEAVIGLEVHIQLNTKSKAFCGDRAAYSTDPNSQVSAISLAHPGTLPRINRAQVQSAIRLGLALKSEINQRSFFDRKHYFYADLPKGFQTTQDNAPICLGGTVLFLCDGSIKTCKVHHIHMEEDAGKSIHDLDEYHSFIDLNRAGVPLLELVTEPDLRSAEDVFHFIHALRQLVRFLDISDGNMEEGSLRCDCNVSVREKGTTQLNARCEVKNVNSARYARKAVQYEIERQTAIYKAGGKVSQDTLEFIPELGITRSLRGKEDAHDYRYFPEPDLPPLVISQEEIDASKNELPILPMQHYKRLVNTYHLSEADAQQLIDHKDSIEYYEKVLSSEKSIQPLDWAKLFLNHVRPYLDDQHIAYRDFPLKPKHLGDFMTLLREGKIAKSTIMQKLWPALLETQRDVLELTSELGLDATTDTNTLRDIVEEVILANPDQVEKYRKGKKAVLGFFMGQVMRRTEGKSNPGQVKKTLTERLSSDH